MANRYMKRSSTPVIIRKMLISTTMRYHFIYVRMAISGRKEGRKEGRLVKITNVAKNVKEREPYIRKLVQPPTGHSMEFTQKTKNTITI